MKDIILLYDHCCIYEIVILNYFLNFTGGDVVFCSLTGDKIKAMEGYSINVDMPLENVDFSQVRSVIIPGGKVDNIRKAPVLDLIRKANSRKILIAAICAAVDIVDEAGILEGIRSTHSTQEDCVQDGNVITARANAYVDFAIEVGKALDLFESEQDLQETIAFWKEYQRVQSKAHIFHT